VHRRWERRGNQIVKTFARADFAHAMMFVNEVAAAAEAAGQHPDIIGGAQAPRR
jgi:pterin-4a-carbinolamine dehydratase